jgi:hypothetical protein
MAASVRLVSARLSILHSNRQRLACSPHRVGYKISNPAKNIQIMSQNKGINLMQKDML